MPILPLNLKHHRNQYNKSNALGSNSPAQKSSRVRALGIRLFPFGNSHINTIIDPRIIVGAGDCDIGTNGNSTKVRGVDRGNSKNTDEDGLEAHFGNDAA
jgi:hypothetical protein